MSCKKIARSLTSSTRVTRQTAANTQETTEEPVKTSSLVANDTDLTIRHFIEQQAHDRAKKEQEEAAKRGSHSTPLEILSESDEELRETTLTPPVEDEKMEEEEEASNDELVSLQIPMTLDEMSHEDSEKERSQNTVKEEENSEGNKSPTVRYFQRNDAKWSEFTSQERSNFQIHKIIYGAVLRLVRGVRHMDISEVIRAYRFQIGDTILDEECEYAHTEPHGKQMRTIIELNPQINIFELINTPISMIADVLNAFCRQQNFYRTDCCPHHSLIERSTQQLNVACGMVAALRLDNRLTSKLMNELKNSWGFFENFQKNLIRKDQSEAERNAARVREERAAQTAANSSQNPQVLDNALLQHLHQFEQRIIEQLQHQARENTDRLNAQREWVEQYTLNQQPGPRATLDNRVEENDHTSQNIYQQETTFQPVGERVPTPFQEDMPQVNAPLAELEESPHIHPLEIGGPDERLNLTIGNNQNGQANVLVSLEIVPTWEEFIPASDSCTKLLTFIRKCIAKGQDLRINSWPKLLQLQVDSQYRLYLYDLRDAGDTQARPVNWHELSPTALLSFIEHSSKATGNKLARTPME